MIRAALIVLAIAAPAAAQERGAVEQEAIVALSYTLGESHALRQACEGDGDDYWRARMARMAEAEAPGLELDGQMQDAFNRGYASRQGERCSPREQSDVARRGEALSRRLGDVVHRVRVQPVIEEQPSISVAEQQTPR